MTLPANDACTVRVPPLELWERTARVRCAKRRMLRATGRDFLTGKELLTLLPRDAAELDPNRRGRKGRWTDVDTHF